MPNAPPCSRNCTRRNIHVPPENGLNTVTGDPTLDKERLVQIDAGIRYLGTDLRLGLSGYHAWIRDYITFENTNVFRYAKSGAVEQVQLKYINTDLATLTGAEFQGEIDVASPVTCFGTCRFVDTRSDS